MSASALEAALEDIVRRVVREAMADESAQIVAKIQEALARQSGTERRALSIDEAAERWNVSPKTIRRRIAAGEVESRRIGSRVVVLAAELEEAIEGRKTA